LVHLGLTAGPAQVVATEHGPGQLRPITWSWRHRHLQHDNGPIQRLLAGPVRMSLPQGEWT